MLSAPLKERFYFRNRTTYLVGIAYTICKALASSTNEVIGIAGVGSLNRTHETYVVGHSLTNRPPNVMQELFDVITSGLSTG